ncbi:D-aminoacyl-tRNA deacylase [Pseudomonas matsuisoli]|uniref:D-aminoacyl-tRNA deacylase n=1 Tax=Pseudomonas matsuisoli TaxID=1515666 RepID=A0A917PYI8_9PSED|nr:D-aminoacyl-tRNA deacylase [Pseudomonas matsuisoli]GGJ99465.1 D-aminoacyl-tRNA deacylase [Pseudomonas matsuisoli]
MKALIQRVRHARVEVDGEVVGAIDAGLLAFIGVEREDDPSRAARLLERLLGYRVFADENGRMNRSLADVEGGLLLVSQFTLVADTQSGMRPSFSSAAPPEKGRELFELMLTLARERHSNVGCGRFGADMQVSLLNDGPVTFLLES